VIKFAALAREPFILFAPGFALNLIILNACRAAGFEPNIVAESSQVDFIIELVAVNSGIAFLPRMIAEQKQHRLVRRIPISQPDIYWHIAMIWRRGTYLSEAAKAWLALTDEFKRTSE
jgi:DNA-binding transcriptional LysR family regulator